MTDTNKDKQALVQRMTANSPETEVCAATSRGHASFRP